MSGEDWANLYWL